MSEKGESVISESLPRGTRIRYVTSRTQHAEGKEGGGGDYPIGVERETTCINALQAYFLPKLNKSLASLPATVLAGRTNENGMGNSKEALTNRSTTSSENRASSGCRMSKEGLRYRGQPLTCAIEGSPCWTGAPLR